MVKKMVEVSTLYDLDIYTLAGQYVGQVHDVVLNIRYGTISRLQVKALEPERKSAGFRDIFRGGFQFVPEEEVGRTDLKRPKPPVAGEEMSIRPRPEPVRAAPIEAQVEAPMPKAQ